MKSRRNYLISWNLASMALLATVAAAAGRQMPTAVTAAELDALSGGAANQIPGFLAVNANSNNQFSVSYNTCYQCSNVAAPANGSIWCAGVSQYLIKGPYVYGVITSGVTCAPEARYNGPNCTGKALYSGGTCTSTMTTYSDP